MYRGPFKYKIVLAGDSTNRKIVKKIYNQKAVNFSSPLTKTSLPKLYIISIDKEVVYIGFTSQSITTRLNSGLKADGLNGYHGYKWKNVQDEFELSVFVFQNMFGDHTEENKMYYQFVETIEAELVYLIRNKTGNWPRYQSEIHFHYEKTKTAKEKALDIYTKLME
jgi:hypothetical protein